MHSVCEKVSLPHVSFLATLHFHMRDPFSFSILAIEFIKRCSAVTKTGGKLI